MREVLEKSAIFRGLEEGTLSRVEGLARRQRVQAGDHVFVLGQEAEHLYVILEGQVEICLPIAIGGTIKEISVESKGVGAALGWSAFVSPFRFRLSARAADDCELAVFSREDMQRLLEEEPRAGILVLTRVAEVIGARLLTMQALWARELQRAVTAGLQVPPHPESVDSAK